MLQSDLLFRVAEYALQKGEKSELIRTELTELMVLRNPRKTSFKPVLYNPLLCLILQGAKETRSGKHTLEFSAGESLIVSHHLPVFSRITEADEQKPYIAMVLSLDMRIVRSLYDELGDTDIEGEAGRAMHVGQTDPMLVDALGRLFDLLDRPLEEKVMKPLLLREIHFRILMAQHGVTLRQLLLRDSHANRMQKVIARIKSDFSTPIAVTELADVAGMSLSSFHEHFKALTATTPLQYQKNLRLIEARRLLVDEGHTVSSAAFQVGYESPTQFSREYSRKFGISPRMDKAA